MVFSLSAAAFAEEGKEEPDLKTFLSELAEKDEVTEEDLSELFTIVGNLIAREVGTGLSDSDAGHKITSDEFSLYYGLIDLGEKLKLYFCDGAEDLPYMDVSDWLPLMNLMVGDSKMGISFTMETDGPVVTLTRHNNREEAMDNGVPLTIDFEKDFMEFQDYNLFCMRGQSSTILDTVNMPVFNDAGEPTLLEKVDSGTYTRYGDALTFPLKDYGIDLIMQDGLYLIPLQTLSDIFLPSTGMGCLYFNGQNVIMTSDVSGCADLYYAAPTGERSEALTEYGYNELCLMLDYFYGLKDTHQIDSFAQFFHDIGFDVYLKGSEVKQADGAIYRLITDFLRDGHSTWRGFSYLTGPIDYEATDSSRMKISEHYFRQEEAREKFYPDGIPGYEEVGNTAYITFDSFTKLLQPNDYYEMDPEDYPEGDTIGLIIKAHAMITREDSPIENVVLDLSMNLGGADNVSAFVVPWLLGEGAPGMVDNMTGAMCTTTYRSDVNLDRVFDERDTVADRNLFCLISPASFSNGNYVPCELKASGKVTLLGRTSGGGACTILPASTAWGTSFQISSNNVTSFLKNGSFYDIDRGAEPDFVLPTTEQYYDRAALTDYINSICWNTNP